MSFLDRFLTPKKEEQNNSAAEKYLEHWENIFNAEPLFYRNESLQKDIAGVSVLVFKDFPERGLVTGITYGLSLVHHPAWKNGRGELCICVESESLDWPQVAGYIANKLRGDCPFSYGNTINFGQPISDDSQMDAFLVFAPGIFENKEDYLDIDVGRDYKISVAALYPIYSEEMKVIEQTGLEQFWHHPDFDMFDVKRKRITI